MKFVEEIFKKFLPKINLLLTGSTALFYTQHKPLVTGVTITLLLHFTYAVRER
jgi:hypothetical protein